MKGEKVSSLLRDYMERRKVSRRELANGTGLGDIVYKYVKGTRNIPNIMVIDRLADYIQCTPAEKETLIQAWRIDTYGTQRLQRWKNLEDFFAHYTLDLSEGEGYSFHINIQKDTKPYIFLHNKLEVQQAILALLDDSAHSSSGHKREKTAKTDSEKRGQSSYTANGLLRIPSKDLEGGVYAVTLAGEEQLLNLFRFAEQRAKKLRIQHIFCLPSPEYVRQEETEGTDFQDKEDNSLLSLKYLQAVIPLTLESPHYESRYYYAKNFSEKIWPFGSSVLLSDRYAVLYGRSREGKNGIFSSDPELLRFLKKTFRQVYQDSHPFLTHAASYQALLNTYYSPLLTENTGSWFSYCEQPCLCPYLTPEMIGKYMHEGAPSTLMDNFVKNITWYRETQLTQVREFSRLSGLRHFLATGRMDEIPKELYDPLSLEDRIAVLDAWMKAQENHPTRFLRLNDEENSRLSVQFFPKRGLNISFYADELFCAFSTDERNLLDSFDDYFNHIEEDHLYPVDEAHNVIAEMRRSACEKDNNNNIRVN